MFIFLISSCATKKTADFYFQQGKHKAAEGYTYAAIESFTKAIEKNPNYVEAYTERASANMHTDSIWNAIKDYDSLLIKTSSSEYIKKGNLYLLKGDAYYMLTEDSLACLFYEKSELMNNSKSWERLRKRCKK